MNAYERGNNLSGSSDSSSDEDDDADPRAEWSDLSSQSELASTLEKLERLEEELATEAGSFSEGFPREIDDRFRGSEFPSVYQVPQAYALQRESAAYRYPLSSSLGHLVPRRAIHSAGDVVGPEMRWIRSQRTGFGLRGDRFAPSSSSSATRTEQVCQQKISRWAKGREKVQHAATNHATWLAGLCEELNEYGAKYTRVEGGSEDTSARVQFAHEEDGEDL
ncbi:hypothetical protein PHYPSEUDO_001450 [Phytophthora pseudosyringae]|uniref:Uncharacterized protein n=1 Tax=Phytophthora pseudosyringae TaxID=221518 RepID=A0A8T1W011_9STRA|nr:hypothetical protein PHYPSEUDO_001450 [Phytophthora pseudosyringae]